MYHCTKTSQHVERCAVLYRNIDSHLCLMYGDGAREETTHTGVPRFCLRSRPLERSEDDFERGATNALLSPRRNVLSSVVLAPEGHGHGLEGQVSLQLRGLPLQHPDGRVELLDAHLSSAAISMERTCSGPGRAEYTSEASAS